MRRRIIWMLAAVVLLAGCGEEPRRAGTASGGLPGDGRPAVTLGTKNFTEQYVLGELYAQALRAQGFEVELKTDIGSTEVVHRALESRSIDLYPEYTGTILGVVKGDRRLPRGAQRTYDEAQAFERARGLRLLRRSPFEDRDGIAVTEAFARANGDLREISDLRPLGAEVTIGGSPEFRTRYQGYRGMREVYGLRAGYRPLEIGQVYPRLADGSIQAGSIFTTDGELAEGRYRVLDDDRQLFGSQHVAPLVAEEVLRREGRDFTRTLDRVTAALTTEAMQAMNASAAAGDAAGVARTFLRSRGLLDPLP